jgi:hypothetical protein
LVFGIRRAIGARQVDMVDIFVHLVHHRPRLRCKRRPSTSHIATGVNLSVNRVIKSCELKTGTP